MYVFMIEGHESNVSESSMISKKYILIEGGMNLTISDFLENTK